MESISFTKDDISAEAVDAIRLTFNPSSDARVQEIKMLAGRLITIFGAIRDDKAKGAGREAAVAITSMQTASMWGVLAATKGFAPK